MFLDPLMMPSECLAQPAGAFVPGFLIFSLHQVKRPPLWSAVGLTCILTTFPYVTVWKQTKSVSDGFTSMFSEKLTSSLSLLKKKSTQK